MTSRPAPRDSHSLQDEICDYVKLFGFLQKNVNGLDILIEEGKQLLRSWGVDEPYSLLISSRLTAAMQMNSEGPDGELEEGVKSYRGIRIIHSRKFQIEEGGAPRDVLRRRVRVSEFSVISNCSSGYSRQLEQFGGQLGSLPRENICDCSYGARLENNQSENINAGGGDGDAVGDVRLYDESSDSFVVIPYSKLLEQCRRFITRANNLAMMRQSDDPLSQVRIPEEIGSVLLLRPNIEHYMFGVIMGKSAGIEDLGAALGGQSKLSCFDDRVLRMWDVSYDGYVGGKDTSILDWGSDTDVSRFIKADNDLYVPYSGPSIVVLPLPSRVHALPSPLPLVNAHSLTTSDLLVEYMQSLRNRVAETIGDEHIDGLRNVVSSAYDILHMHKGIAAANIATMEKQATFIRLAYDGTYQYKLERENVWAEKCGCGHHGPDCVGKASDERNGKGAQP